jgi:OOP family OmpA-OmpF porin
MHRFGVAFAAGGLAVLAAAAAQAQDTMSWANGFYVRGDVGGAIGDETTFRGTNPTSAGTLPVLGTSPAEAETGVASLVGVGIGYRLNPIFRGDFTVDYMPGFRLRPVAMGATPSGFIFGAGNLDSTVGLANAYVQLDGLLPGAFSPFQPYVDGGVGFAYHHLDTLSVNATPGNALTGSTQTNFAWGVGAGVAYPITGNLSLDLAYRFLNLGPIKTGISATAVGGVNFPITSAKSDDLSVHTLTAGLRWSFGPVDPVVASAANGTARDLFWWVPNGVYMRGDLGGAIGNKITLKDTSANPAVCTFCSTSTLPTNIGNSAFFGAGLGYRISPLFRADVTVDDMPSLHASGSANGVFAGVASSSDIHSLVGLANFYVDLNGFAPGFFGPIQPFIDGGVGLAHNEMSPTTGPFIGAFSGSARTNFAWGAGAGVGYAVTPNLTVEIAYKYLDLGPVETGGALATGFGAVPVSKLRSNDLTVHTVTAGLRWSFGAPPAPPPATTVAAPASPPAAAVAAPAKQMFIVFFEFDKSSLTAEGKQVVDAAAVAFKSGKSGVAIAGYTDLAGTQQYNLALSKRRADTVKAALVKDGVPASTIDETWHGKENPRVPTADGVREPQNRRVEIAM